MKARILKVPKTEKEVSLWVNPDGLVKGSLFLLEQSHEHAGQEEPIEVLNQDSPFVVVRLHKPEQLRFYNRTSLIRVEYEQEENNDALGEQTIIPCTIHLMDGSILEGTIRETLPPERARLFDYLNREKARFIRLYLSDTEVCLINKAFINYVSPSDETH
ncbi:MAG: hypothetical protein RI563_00140 [Thiohalophilus sp.]|uniref:hypothetical protein n=1 Tax=Thiohalophilus sp. TaxID=3028392 RepID=UPI00286FDA09|nr:hypothetical protein [Thiohalophilus sp.]MDR9435253.1 hypothetical protein [Thiohalophilus sp.]